MRWLTTSPCSKTVTGEKTDTYRFHKFARFGIAAPGCRGTRLSAERDTALLDTAIYELEKNVSVDRPAITRHDAEIINAKRSRVTFAG